MRSNPLKQDLVCLVMTTFALAFGGGSSLVIAGAAPPIESIATDQAIAQEVVTYPQPLAGFRPLSASDAELEVYGYPPRPDTLRAPMAYAHWKRVVSVPRVANPKIRQTNIYSGPVQYSLGSPTRRNGTVLLSSPNWSGYGLGVPIGTFFKNNSDIFAQWVVPVAQQAFGVCDGGWDYSVQWDGFDGVTSNDVLQAGTSADACCSTTATCIDINGAANNTDYFSWFEWFPGPMIAVSIPAVRPGDLVSSYVWFTTAPPFGHAYLVNYTLAQAGAYAFYAPAGTSFLGDSAEWVVERPAFVGGGLANLTNYTADQFNISYAYNFNSLFLPAASPSGTTTYAFSMVCPPWTPSSSCPSTTVISAPSLYPLWALWFYDSPPAL